MNPNLSSPARSIYVAGRINPAALVLIDLISEHCNRKGLLLGAQTAPFEQNVDYLWANGRTWPRASPAVFDCAHRRWWCRAWRSLQTIQGPARRGAELRSTEAN